MLPKEIDSVLEALESAGYDAYIVGGCVRDGLTGREVSDYDVTTSATPEEVERVFKGHRVIETGIKHGTVTVLSGDYPVEITTFRRDGEYRDGRHPESVTFTTSIGDDLSRRDFTVNSMACDRRGNVVDPFGGKKDAARRIIRCTGEPEKRFGEDALRIIRALRFSSVLGFEIEEKTAAAIHKMKNDLLTISAERVFSELKKLLCGRDVYRVLRDYSDVVCTLIPEMTPAVGFDQMSRYHSFDVYTHIIKSVEAIEPDPVLRLAMLFHDIGKPYACTEEEPGVRHFRGHGEISERIARERLAVLRADNETVRLVALFCRIHDRPIVPERRPVRRVLSMISFDEFLMLCKVKRADCAAQAPEYRARAAQIDEIERIGYEIVKDNECFSLSDLAVDGNDLAALGLRGKQIGDALKEILSLVIDEKLPNEKAAIIEYIKGSD